MNPTSTAMAVAFWLGLGVLTFVICSLGYGTGFWHFRGRRDAVALGGAAPELSVRRG
jgi:hypothetical protein